MPNVWFTSDLHLGHRLVAEVRGFDSTDDHDDILARRWDRRVQESDVVWVLGDVAMGGWRDRLPWLAQRPGVKHLVLGNHDRAHPLNSRSHDYIRVFMQVFETVQTSARINLDGLTVLASHFPYAGDRGEDRFTQWRLRDEGKPLIHGHLHTRDIVTHSSKGTRQVHVGLDAWGFNLVHRVDLLDAFR